MQTGERDVIIAVMGATGAGKSTFIQRVSGRNDVIVGHSLISETQELHPYAFMHRGTKYVLIDTPGFDDTMRKESQIKEQILQWLAGSFAAKTRLNGVIYLHRILDPRMGGTALRNNRMFRAICGPEAFKNVILATTFWEKIDASVGARREEELRSNKDFWGGMLSNGAKMARLAGTRDSGLELLEQMSHNEKIVLAAQDEMVNQDRAVIDTSVMREEKEAIEKKRKLELEKREARLKLEREAEKTRQEAAAKQAREREILRKQQEKQAEERRREEERDRAEKIRLAKERAMAEQQRLAEQRRLENERRETARRQAEELRLAQERKEAQARYERQLEANRLQRQKEEEERQREYAELERQREMEEAAAQRRRKEYQRRYVCIKYSPQWPCDNCGGSVRYYQNYYHCCFCDNDKYFHCGSCGNDCGEATHPYMTQYEQSDSCIVM